MQIFVVDVVVVVAWVMSVNLLIIRTFIVSWNPLILVIIAGIVVPI